MTTLTPERLAELDALHAAMTLGTRHLMAGMPTNVLTDGGLRVARCDFDGTVNAEAECNARGIVALHNDYPALSAALRVAWAERDQWRTYAHDVEGVTQSIAEIMTGEPDTSGIVHRAHEIKAERDRLAARLAEAEELLRPLAACAETFVGRCADAPDSLVVTVNMGQCRAAAAFLARTEPAK